MTSLRQIAEALADRVETVIGRATSVVENKPYPFAMVLPPTVSYVGISGTSGDVEFGVVVLVSAALDRKQLDLMDYADPTGAKSIPAAIQSDPSLGLAGVHAFVSDSRSLEAEEIAAYNAFGSLFVVPVRLG